MQVYVRDNIGFIGSLEDFDRAVEVLGDMSPPKVKKINTEYALVVSIGSVCIFRVSIGKEPELIKGTMLAQVDMGSLKIGFVDIHDENIVDSIYTTIQQFWCIIGKDVYAECSINSINIKPSMA